MTATVTLSCFGRLNDGSSKGDLVLIPAAHAKSASPGKGDFADVIKDREVGRLPWIIPVDLMSSQEPFLERHRRKESGSR